MWPLSYTTPYLVWERLTKTVSRLLVWLFVGLIELYRRYISVWLPPACRYTPTCSEYAQIALRRYGIFRGGWMAIWRVLRCHPGCDGGEDPVL